MTPKRRRPWVGFALSTILAVCGLFVLDGIASGVVVFAAFLAFLGACMYALKAQDPEARKRSERNGLGWIWF